MLVRTSGTPLECVCCVRSVRSVRGVAVFAVFEVKCSQCSQCSQCSRCCCVLQRSLPRPVICTGGDLRVAISNCRHISLFQVSVPWLMIHLTVNVLYSILNEKHKASREKAASVSTSDKFLSILRRPKNYKIVYKQAKYWPLKVGEYKNCHRILQRKRQLLPRKSNFEVYLWCSFSFPPQVFILPLFFSFFFFIMSHLPLAIR